MLRDTITSMLSAVLEFLVAYVGHLNAKKIFGTIIVLAGLGIMGSMGTTGNADKAVFVAIAGILVGSVGFVIIYYDIAKDKTGAHYDEMETLVKAAKSDPAANRKITSWGLKDPSNKTSSDK